MTIFYIKMKIRAGGGNFRAAGGGGALGQQGAPPAIPLYGKHYMFFKYLDNFYFHFIIDLYDFKVFTPIFSSCFKS